MLKGVYYRHFPKSVYGIKMQKLHRIKSPALKRAVIGLGLVAAFGAGYQVNEAKWQRLQRLQPKEAPKKMPQASFRIDEFTPEGVRIADLNAIDTMVFVNPDSAKFAVYRMDSLREAVKRCRSKKDKKGRKLADVMSFPQIEKQKNKLLPRLNVDEYSEDYLQAAKAYYDLVCLEVYKASRLGENQELWDKNDAELRTVAMVEKRLINVKLSVMRSVGRRSAYPQEEFEKDYRRMRLAASLRQARNIRQENNKAVDYLMVAREEELRAAFELKKDSLRQALYDEAEQKRQAEKERFLRPFMVDSAAWAFPLQSWKIKQSVK